MHFSQEKLISLRRISQSACFTAVVLVIWNTRFPLDRFVSPKIFFQIDPLVMLSTAAAERVFLKGLVWACGLLAATAVLGRFFCGWMCPLGATIDFLALLKKPFTRKRRTIEKSPSRLRYVKYTVLAAIIVPAAAGYQFAWFLDPIAVFMRMFSLVVQPSINNGINSLFTSLLQRWDIPALEGIYNALQESVIGTDIVSLANTRGIVTIFALITLLVLAKRRFWCRYLCPLGAMLALPARLSPLERSATCGKKCRACMHSCRMNAISRDNSYMKEECILCFDCVRDCPDSATSFAFSYGRAEEKGDAEKPDPGMAAVSRAGFLRYSAYTALTVSAVLFARRAFSAAAKRARDTLRPPGALDTDTFVRRCIRCGNCMKICPTGVLVPSPLRLGVDTMWSPVLDTSLSYCEYTCNLCGKVCPTGAIRSLSPGQKTTAVIGSAVIDRELCVPYKKGIDCIVCEEHCPVPEKAIAIKMTRVKGKLMKAPVVLEKLCIGCGICEIKCPVGPDKAIKVFAAKNPVIKGG